MTSAIAMTKHQLRLLQREITARPDLSHVIVSTANHRTGDVLIRVLTKSGARPVREVRVDPRGRVRVLR